MVDLMSIIPTYTAPAGGKLTSEMVSKFRDAGVLILEGFVSTERCRQLREHTLALIDAFDPADVKHVFSAMEQTQLGDKYFEESGDKIRFFFESDAFDAAGNHHRKSDDHSFARCGHHDIRFCDAANSSMNNLWNDSLFCLDIFERALNRFK